jgi:lysophospholipase L1-like esterase
MDLPDRFIVSDSFQSGCLWLIFLMLDLVIIYFPLRIFVRARLGAGRRILFEIIYVAAALVLMESAAAIFEHRNPDLFIPEARRFWTLNPGYAGTPASGPFSRTPDIRISAQGLRNEEVPVEKPAGEKRVLVLGDSCPFGENVRLEYALSSVLEKKLQESYRASAIRVINAAVPGYSTFQGLDMYERVGAPLKPDLLVVAFNNDSMLEGKEDKARAASPLVQEAQSVLYKVRLYRFLRKCVTVLAARTSPPSAPASSVPRVSEEDLRKNLRRFVLIAGQHKAGVLVVGLPLARIREGMRLFSFENPQGAARHRKIMKEAAAEEGYSFFDVMPQWEKEGMDSHMMDFCHPDAQGHQRLGEMIGGHIIEEGLLP